MSVPQFWLRDASYGLLDLIDACQSFHAIRRWNATGTWSMGLAPNSRFVQYFLPTSGIVLKLPDQNGAAKTVFSGNASVSLQKTLDAVTISGVDDMVLLEEPARPTPSLSAPDPITNRYPDDYDVRTGVTSSIMAAYVGVNIGAAAPSDCKISQLFLLADPLLGGVQTGRANLQSLQAILSGLAVTPTGGGLAYEILQSDVAAGRLDLRIWAPVDRTADAKFGVGLDTIQDYTDTLTYAGANTFVVLGGDDLGANRAVVQAVDAAAVLAAGRRITDVTDARGITDFGELQQKAAERMAGAVNTRKTSVTPVDAPGNTHPAFWGLGDLVSVVGADGVPYTGVIREIRYDYTPESGLIVTPLIGDPASTNDDVSAQQIKAVNTRLSNLERNYNVPDDSITPAMLTAPIGHALAQVGQVVAYAGAVAPGGWHICDGSAVSRTTYAALFAIIGGTYGAGDGTTTFNLPDARGRFILGVSGSHAIGTTGGAETATGPAHTHPGSHSHGMASHTHTGAAHTHPGSHSHGHSATHTHSVSGHTHTVNLDHTHGTFTSGGENTFAATFSTYPTATTNISHTHQVTITALGTTNVTSGSGGSGTSGSTSAGSTDSDSNVFAATAGSTGAASPTSTDADSNAYAANYGATIATMPPFVAINYIIYTSV